MTSFLVRFCVYAFYAAVILSVRWLYHRPTFNELTFNIDAAPSNYSHRTFSDPPSKIKESLQLDILDERTIIVSWLWKGGELYGYFSMKGIFVPSREFKIAERINHPYTVLKYGPNDDDIGVIYQSGGYAWMVPSLTLKNNTERQFLPIFRGFSQLRFGEDRVYAYSRDTGVLTTYYFGHDEEGANFTVAEERRSFIGFSISDFYVDDYSTSIQHPYTNRGLHTIKGGCSNQKEDVCRHGKFTSFTVKSGSYPLLTVELVTGLLLFPVFLSIPTFLAFILPNLEGDNGIKYIGG